MLVFCLCTSTIEPASRASVKCSIPLLSLPGKEEKGKPPSTAIVKYLYLLRFLSFKPVFIHVRTFSMIPRLFPFLKGLWWGIPQSLVERFINEVTPCAPRGFWSRASLYKNHVDSFHVYYMYPSEDPNRSPYWDVYSLGYK